MGEIYTCKNCNREFEFSGRIFEDGKWRDRQPDEEEQNYCPGCRGKLGDTRVRQKADDDE